jgi:hypothetical protein
MTSKVLWEKEKTRLHRQFMLDAFDDIDQVMPNRNLQRMALQIVDYILIILHPCLGLKCMREVMEKVCHIQG